MDKFWPSLIPAKPINISGENKSIDVALKDCFDNFNATACIRNSLLSFLGFVTFFLCIIRIIRLHVLHHPQIHQYLVFYSASFEVIFLIVRWIAVSNLFQLEFTAWYLKLIQFILLCHFHWSLVSRILHQKRLISWVIIPLLAGFFGFLTSISVMGVLSQFSSWIECLAPHWLVLSFAEFLGIQLYVVAGIYITKKINSISALDSFKWEQKRDLWSVIMTYEFSSAISLAYYTTLQILGNQEIGCSGIFAHEQEIYSPVYAVFMISKYLLPIWVMLLVFYPTRGCLSSEDERLLGWSGDGSTTSVFSPGTRYQETYKQLTLPVENGMNYEYSSMRRSASSPAFFAKPQLTPISEEDSLLPPSRIPCEGYGAFDSVRSQPETSSFHVSRTRSRHDSGKPSKGGKGRRYPVSLNQCSDEIESVTPSSGERT